MGVVRLGTRIHPNEEQHAEPDQEGAGAQNAREARSQHHQPVVSKLALCCAGGACHPPAAIGGCACGHSRSASGLVVARAPATTALDTAR
jgi:hypothetical protein